MAVSDHRNVLIGAPHRITQRSSSLIVKIHGSGLGELWAQGCHHGEMVTHQQGRTDSSGRVAIEQPSKVMEGFSAKTQKRNIKPETRIHVWG